MGMIKGDEYNRCALEICRLLCGICCDPKYEDFSLRALAPGWRMLCQPPATAEDVAIRYTRDEERSIDVDLMDGAFFIPDGDFFGTEKHKIWHCTKAQEPRILAAALYLTVASISKNMDFYSDLSLEDLAPAFRLMHHFTGLKPRISELYYDYANLKDQDRLKTESYYNRLLEELD